MCEEYNGWKNRETWALMLHVNNDEYLQGESLSVATDAFNDSIESVMAGEENPQDDRTSAICSARDAFQEWAEGFLTVDGYQQQFGDDMPVNIVRMLEDIGSLYRVDWYQCAENLLEDSLREFDDEHMVSA